MLPCRDLFVTDTIMWTATGDTDGYKWIQLVSGLHVAGVNTVLTYSISEYSAILGQIQNRTDYQPSGQPSGRYQPKALAQQGSETVRDMLTHQRARHATYITSRPTDC